MNPKLALVSCIVLLYVCIVYWRYRPQCRAGDSQCRFFEPETAFDRVRCRRHRRAFNRVANTKRCCIAPGLNSKSTREVVLMLTPAVAAAVYATLKML